MARPRANLYNNQDGTFSGRFPQAPFVDFELEQTNDDPLTLEVQAYNRLAETKMGSTLVFKPGSSASNDTLAAMGLARDDDEDDASVTRAEEKPSFCLVTRSGKDGPRMCIERRIIKGGGNAASGLAALFS